MRIEYKFSGASCEIALFGELDHHAAKTAIAEINAWLDQTMPFSVVLNMQHITFMDSSGIALILAVYKRTRFSGGKLSLTSLPPPVKRILRAAGIERLLDLSA